MEAEMAEETQGTIRTIKIPKGDRLEGKVPIGVNGRIVTVNTDQSFKAGDHILEALNNAFIKYVVISDDGSEVAPADAGVASAGVPEITATASREEAALDESGTGPNDHNDLLHPTYLGGDGQGDAPTISGLGTGSDSADDSADSTASESGAPAVEPGPLDKSVPDLTAHLETVTDEAEIDKLIDAEKAGKSRVGALAALDARKAVLTKPAE
jgi:hypothetical protein